MASLDSVTMRTTETPRNKGGAVCRFIVTRKQQENPNIVIGNRNVLIIMKPLYSKFFSHFPYLLQREQTLAYLCLLYRLMWSGRSLPIWPHFSPALPALAFHSNLLFNNTTSSSLFPDQTRFHQAPMGFLFCSLTNGFFPLTHLVISHSSFWSQLASSVKAL